MHSWRKPPNVPLYKMSRLRSCLWTTCECAEILFRSAADGKRSHVIKGAAADTCNDDHVSWWRLYSWCVCIFLFNIVCHFAEMHV